MKISGKKYVRFKDSNSESSFSSEGQSNRGLFPLRKPSFRPIVGGIRRAFDRVSLDPLFFYTPVVDTKNFCLSLDENLEITACVLRSFIDIFYIFHIVLQFHTGFIAPSSRVFGRGELIEDRRAIAKRYLSSYFIVDILSILPLPQVVILIVIPSVNAPISLATKDLLKIVIFAQYIPRILRIYPLSKEVNRTSGLFTETAWAGAAFNLLLYMLASHVFGSFWYLIAIERKDRCWRIACGDHNGCKLNDLYCGDDRGNTSFLNSSCPLLEPNEIKSPADFDFGIFLDALQSHVAEHRDFPRKLTYCFWWGLRNLSSLGQNLKTSTFVGEILFAVSISIVGLVLSLLIGNMQKYLQSITVRIEEMRMKRRDAEQWMSHRMLPENLRARIRRYEQYKWQENRGVEEESLIRNLPKDLRRDIKRHLCWTLLTRVPMFEKMDEQLLDAMCSRLKPVLYTENSFIVREGDPVDEMLFIMRGNIFTMTTNGGRTGFFNSVYLMAGDFCGEELLTWALDPNSSSSLPISTRTVQAVKDVEAFCLMPDDLKSVTSQFRRLHSKQLQHTFRQVLRSCSIPSSGRHGVPVFIQAAWRRHYRRKIEKTLQEAEDRLHNALAKEGSGSSPSLAATIYASRFATNMLGNLRRNHPHNTISSPKLPPLLLQKPAEPDFSAENPS
ncbi:UNVERIFIED_CONTAM: Cyclic nucleotide-gated ion channel 1 [Sesamum latifolium]|uniref:Cyclic nucleotide-gated ion channel 1 n=1 Tax=Sesamum latifolium TaxID=2727402 RepID=A0AAW2U7A5_9LAMI